MTEPTPLTRSTRVATPEKLRSGDTFPPLLLQQSVRRLRIVALIILVAMTFGWVGEGLLEGTLGGDFHNFGQWAPPTFVMLFSLLMYLIARGDRIPARAILGVAVVYQVGVSFGIAFGEYWQAFQGFSPELMRDDTVGMSGVALWMLAFAALVPVRPAGAIIGLLGSAAATPIAYLAGVRVGDAPVLPAGQFFWVFVSPYLGVAVIAFLATSIIYRLGREVQRAQELGSYRLERRLGEGGMGEVWCASHRMLARPAAVKLISPAALGDPDRQAETVARFEREAQATAALQSAHSVQLFDFGVADDGRLYYAMELLEGVDLERLVRRFGPLPPERVIDILAQACDSLAEAHRRELVHRDIKPSNIFLCRYALKFDVVKVLDFGLAKHARFESGDLTLSRTGELRGTPAYLSPELVQGQSAVDGRADLYGLGCVGYWLLTGNLVFDAPSPAAMIVAHATQTPVAPSRRCEVPIPPELDELILACLEKDPAARVPTAASLAERLAAIHLERPWTQERAAEWWAASELAAAAARPED